MFYDWYTYFWPQLINPWELASGIFNLPWFFVILQPLRLLGMTLSVVVVEVFTIFVVILLCKKFSIDKFKFIFVLLSPPLLWCMFMGQIDGLILLAYFLPPALQVFLAGTKPQVAAGLGINALRKDPKLVIFAAILGISAWIIWGWPFAVTNTAFHTSEAVSLFSWNLAIWPMGLLLIPMLFIKDERVGLMVSPLIFPRVGLHSFIGPMIILAKLPWKYFLPIWVIFWIRWALMLFYH